MTDPKNKNQRTITQKNVLESLKDLGSGTTVQTKDFAKDVSQDFFRELLGLPGSNIKRSGELNAGQSVQMNEVLNGNEEKGDRIRKQIGLERHLLKEESKTVENKQNELRLELQVIMQEIQKVVVSTDNLAEATQIGMMSAPAEPGIYHINFFKSILEFLYSFRKRLDLATNWLSSTNKRAEKKNYWSMYKKKGSSFLLSPDHYLSRSAG
jgi:hypothetical protein